MAAQVALRAALIVTAALLAWPATSNAWTTPGQHPANPTVLEVVAQARVFWGARNVTGCPDGINSWQAPSLSVDGESAWELGDGSTCEDWFSDDLVASLDPTQRPSVDTLIDACTAIAHGVGHALGLRHTDTGVMAGGASKPPWPHAWAPYFCVVWAQDRIAVWHRSWGIAEAKIRRWTRAGRERILHPPPPNKGVLR